jgi:hypothetical protein
MAHRVRALLVAIHAGLCIATAGTCGATRNNTDLAGGDVRQTVCTGDSQEAMDASCCALCVAQPECEYWVRANSLTDKTCWLKKGFKAEGRSSDRRGAFVNSGPSAFNVSIKTAASTHTITPRVMGCHLDSGFGQELIGLHSNLIFSPSFEYGDPTVEAPKPTPSVGTGWVVINGNGTGGGVTGSIKYSKGDALHGNASVQLDYTAGKGRLGLANRGIGREGLFFEAKKVYEGYLFVKTSAAAAAANTTAITTVLQVGIDDYISGVQLALQTIPIAATATWTRVNFSLTTSAGTACHGITPGTDPMVPCDWWKKGTDDDQTAHVCVKCAGQFFVGLSSPGSVSFDFVYLEPGQWGRFKGLPVLLPMATALQAMGTTVMRAGGTAAQDMFWKDWRGPLWERKPLVWRENEVSGFGPFETIDLCSAAGIEPVLTTAAVGHTAKDMADLVEYAWG